MKKTTQKLYELTINANDTFIQENSGIHTSIGLMDKALRNKGLNAEAITVDNISSKKRVILALLDDNPNVVGVGVGNIDQDNILFLSQHSLNDMSESDIVAIIKNNLLG